MYTTPEKFKVSVTVYRWAKLMNYTIGDYHVDDKKICNSLEDKVRDINKDGDLLDEGETKVYGKTAIPYTPEGKCYFAWVEKHSKFGMCLHIFGVPHFEGIFSHCGNIPEHTLGCILAGYNTQKGMVTNSRKAMNALIMKILEKVDIGEKFPFFVKDREF